MGWSFTHGATKADIIQECTRHQSLPDLGIEYVTLTKKIAGNCLWAVMEKTFTDGRPAERFIALFLLSNERGWGWGYKAMEESVHPYYYSCPLSYLDMVPEACPEWRAKVREYHALRNLKYVPGDIVELGEDYTPPAMIITGQRKRTYIGMGSNGVTYRLPARFKGPIIGHVDVPLPEWQAVATAIASAHYYHNHPDGGTE